MILFSKLLLIRVKGKLTLGHNIVKQTAIEHKMNMAQLMALQQFAHGATTINNCNFKRTALYENDMHYDNKTTINKQILCRYFQFLFQISSI